MKEIWKAIPGYPNYEASNFGNIRSLVGAINSDKTSRRPGRVLKPLAVWNGYHQVCLYRRRSRRYHKVHRLVMAAFLGKSYLHVNHKNGIKTDNRLENLEYCTPSENVRHALKNGLITARGSGHPNSKLTAENVKEIRSSLETQTEIAKRYRISQTLVSKILRRKTWSHV